jgi:hypothetical protein
MDKKMLEANDMQTIESMVEPESTSRSSHKEKINFEEALKKCGGFGRFQIFIIVFFSTSFTTGG